MNSRLKMRLAWGILSALNCPVAAICGGEPPLQLRVHVYNDADVPAHTLDGATKEAARIFAAVGVRIVWQPGLADAPEENISDQHPAGSSDAERDARDYLVLKIVRDFPTRCLPGVLGYSLPEARFGPHAEIFYRRVERVSLVNEVDLATLLGHAMAHEIGHLLLNSTEHSVDGIMKARWGRGDYQNAAKGYVKFTRTQSAQIYQGASVRLDALRPARIFHDPVSSPAFGVEKSAGNGLIP